MILTSFVFLLLAAAVDRAQSQEIRITQNSVIMDCQGDREADVKWLKGSDKEKKQNQTFEVQANRGIVEGFYSCEYTRTTDPKEVIKHVFYLHVKVCDGCYELSRSMAAGVIIGDMLFTGGVILIIYILATRNTGGTQKTASNSRSLNPPQPPNPDYAPLDPKTRSNAVYSGIR